MKLHLYWIEKKWQSRGYAKNLNLIVYFNNKTYKVFVNSFYGYKKNEDIEVKRKIDITNYIDFLKKEGFKEVK